MIVVTAVNFESLQQQYMAAKVDLNQSEGRSHESPVACPLNFDRLKREGGSVALQVEDCRNLCQGMYRFGVEITPVPVIPSLASKCLGDL